MSVLAVSKRLLKQISRDRRSLAMIFISPIVFMLVFGYSFSGELYDVKIAVVNLDRGFMGNKLSEEILSKIDTEVYDIKYFDTLDQALDELEELKVRAVIYFEEDFTETLTLGGIGFTIYLDGGDPVVSSNIYSEFTKAIMNVMKEYGLDLPNDLETIYFYGGEEIRFLDSYIPGMICAAASILSLVLTLISFVRERTRGTLYRMLVTPVSRWSIILGYTLAFASIITIQSLILLAVAVYLFNVKIYGDLLLMMAIVILAGIGYQSTGVALSLYAKNEFQAFQFMPLIFTPSIFLSGVFAPIEALPPYIRPITTFIPLTYAVEAVKNVAIRGWGYMDVWFEITILTLYALSMIVVSRYALK